MPASPPAASSASTASAASSAIRRPARPRSSGTSTTWCSGSAPDHVGLGIDYVYDLGLDEDPPGLDRAHWWPPEHGYGKDGPRLRIAAPEQFPEITAGLLGMGYAETDIRKILGQNMLAVAGRVWRPRAA